MFVDDCCKNSSFFLSILFFSIAPAIFPNCPGRRVDNFEVICNHFSREIVNGSYLFDTAAIVDFDQSGPCEFKYEADRATLREVDTDGREIEDFFSCIYSVFNVRAPELCRNSERVKVKYNIKRPGDRDAFNFGLELVNAQPKFTSLYRYEATFYFDDTSVRHYIKHFKFISGEHNVYLYCLFFKDMMSDE